MIYKIRLNDRIYEVEVEEGVASVLDVQQASAQACAPIVATQPVPQVAPQVAPVVATQPAPQVAPQVAPVAQQSTPQTAPNSANTVKAPLPGSVLEIKVASGQAVKKGQVLVVIEAMKMENEITAGCDGTVGRILTSKGSTVATGAPLIELI